MAEQFRHGAEGYTTHHEPGREGMPQVMPSEVFDSSVFNRRGEPVVRQNWFGA
jgi:hypothetical protein